MNMKYLNHDCATCSFINPPQKFQELKINTEVGGRLTCALSRLELMYLPLGLLKAWDWSCD